VRISVLVGTLLLQESQTTHAIIRFGKAIVRGLFEERDLGLAPRAVARRSMWICPELCCEKQEGCPGKERQRAGAL
jgi:hypothetical protein